MAPQLIVGMQIDAVLAILFAAVLWIVIFDMLRTSLRVATGRPVRPVAETPYVRSNLRADAAAGTIHA